MKLCLVIPPSGFLLDERVFPTLGILRVAAVLRAAGHEVRVLDLSGVADVEGALQAEPVAEWYGVTATTPQLPGAVRIASALLGIAPDARVVLGGPHVTLVTAAARAGTQRGRDALDALRPYFDVLVAGDGERAVFPALDPMVRGLIDADQPGGSLFLMPADLDDAPLPARDAIDLASYRYEIDGRSATSLIAQLGCPFGCGFCGGRSSPTFRRVRLRSRQHVVAELRHLHERYGYTGFMFFDDELNVNPGLVELLDDVAALQEELGVEFRMRGFMKSQLTTRAQAAALHRAGFREVLVGFEAADDRILLNIRKKATRAQNERCVETLHAAGLRVKALMSIGHPGETPETVAAVRDWLLSVAPEDFDVSIITVYPGTPYFDEATEQDGVCTYEVNGDRLYYRPLDFTREVNNYKGVPGSYRAFVWTDAVSSDLLVSLRESVEREVRGRLGIAWPQRRARQFEHSMGQSGDRVLAV